MRKPAEKLKHISAFQRVHGETKLNDHFILLQKISEMLFLSSGHICGFILLADLHPSLGEKHKHERKPLAQSPVSTHGMCPGCCKMTPVSSHAQMGVLCVGCSTANRQEARQDLKQDVPSRGSSITSPLNEDAQGIFPTQQWCLKPMYTVFLNTSHFL